MERDILYCVVLCSIFFYSILIYNNYAAVVWVC